MNPLLKVPGLGGYIAGTEMSQEQDARGLQQVGGVMKLQDAVRAQQDAMRARQMEQAFRRDVAALGPNPDQNALAVVAAKYAAPGEVLKTQQSSLDRQAQAAATKEATLARLTQTAQYQQQMHEYRMRTAATDEARAAELERHNKAVEETAAELARIRGDIRGPRQQLTEIVDPLKPDQMLRIDSNAFDMNKYLAGDKTGVIGVSGKEPGAAKREERESQGKELLRSELDNLKEHYRVLNEARAIPSSERGGMSNAAAWVQGSAVGQLGGRILGTKEQDARNQIQSARLRIMNAIKNATGMSAQQLNSNIELKTWLDSLTSMTGSYESNIGIIDSIENAFLKGKAAPAPAPGTPSPGTPRVVDW